jgi:hypothetical protein
MRFTSQDQSGLHPEFGYLCPTGRLRAGIRVLATLTTTALAFGGALLVFHLVNGPADASDHALAAATFNAEAATNPGAMNELQSDWSASDEAHTARAPAAHDQSTCTEVGRAFLDAACRSTPTRKHHAGRVIHKPMTVFIGRADAPDADALAGRDVATAPAPSVIPLPVARPVPAKTGVNALTPAVAQAHPQKPARPDAPAGALAANDARAPSDPRLAPFGFPFGGLLGPH